MSQTEQMAHEPGRPAIGHLLRRFPYSCVALALALLVMVAGLFWHIDVFNVPGLDIIIKPCTVRTRTTQASGASSRAAPRELGRPLGV